MVCGEAAAVWHDLLGPRHAECVPLEWFRAKAWESPLRSRIILAAVEKSGRIEEVALPPLPSQPTSAPF